MFLKLWCEAPCVSHLELLVTSLCSHVLFTYPFFLSIFWGTYSLSLQVYLSSLSSWVNSGISQGFKFIKRGQHCNFSSFFPLHFEFFFQDRLLRLCGWWCAEILKVRLLRFLLSRLWCLFAGLCHSTRVFSFKLFLQDISKLSVLKQNKW